MRGREVRISMMNMINMINMSIMINMINMYDSTKLEEIERQILILTDRHFLK